MKSGRRMTHTAVRKPTSCTQDAHCTTHASMHSALLRMKSDALRSSARSGYLMRRLRHAVSRPCDAFRAVLEPLLSCASYAADGAAATHPVLRQADRRRVEPTAPSMRRLGPPAGCGGCSVSGKPGRCLLPLCLRALVREGVPGAPCARGGAAASSP